MKKLSFLFIVFFITLFSQSVYAADENNLPLGIEIKGGVTLGNTNANISLGGYMAPFQEYEENQKAYYAYCNAPAFYMSSAPLADEKNQYLIKYNNKKDTEIYNDKNDIGSPVDILSYGFNCMNINNYNDEWIFFMKNNDGCIYKVKTDGAKESKLELPFFVRRFLLVNDRLIIETQFCEYGKILSTDLNGNDLRLIAKCDPRCGDMMIQADEKGVYYYDDVNLELKRISYDGKEETIILRGRWLDGAPVTLFQVSGNKIIVSLYTKYDNINNIILDLDKPIKYEEESDLFDSVKFYIGIPFFEYEILQINEYSYNFSDINIYVLARSDLAQHILGYKAGEIMRHDYLVFKLNSDYIDVINGALNYTDYTTQWDDEVFYEGYVDIMGGSDLKYSVYVVGSEVCLYDPVRTKNITGLGYYSDSELSYRDPDYREPEEDMQ